MRERLRDLERQAEAVLVGDAVPADEPNAGAAPAARLERAMHLILSVLRMEVPYDSCSVQELRDQRLVIVSGIGFADLDVIVGESFDLGRRDIPNGEVVHRRRPLIVADTEQYRAFRRGLHVGADIRSWLGVPMLDGGHVAGVLALDKREPHFYDEAHAAAASDFASLLARVIAGSRRNEQPSYA